MARNVFPEWHKNPPLWNLYLAPGFAIMLSGFLSILPLLPHHYDTTHLPLEAFVKLPK